MNREIIFNKFNKREVYISGWEDKRRAAITIPIVELEEELNVLFQVRSKKLRSQPGDICFPGGKIESSETPLEGAFRETIEELGVNLEDIELINELDTLVRYDNTIVHVFLIYLDIKNININTEEVDHVFYVPLVELKKIVPSVYSNKINIIRDKDFPYDLINGGNNYKFREVCNKSIFYNYKDYNIWGMTAEILSEFLKEL
ncbi:MAG: NUDIX hydrolase [Clostridium sp.]